MKAAEGVIPVNTQSSNEWALRNFHASVEHQNMAALMTLFHQIYHRPLMLSFCANGAAATCMCKRRRRRMVRCIQLLLCALSLLAALQCTMHTNRVPFNIFDKANMRFRDLHMTLYTVCVALTKEGIGADIKHAAVISLEHKELMWKNSTLGVDSPASTPSNLLYRQSSLLFAWWARAPQFEMQSIYSCSD